MRCASFCVFISALPLLALAPEGGTTAPPSPDDVTVVLSFDGASSTRSVEEMKRETQSIFLSSGIHLAWKNAADTAGSDFNDLVVVRFRGSCVLDPGEFVPTYDESGPIASAAGTGESVLPFTEVACGKLERLVRPALSPTDYTRADLLMGRAMGRVLAHELVHMLTKSDMHGSSGVAKAKLSGKQLIAASLPLDSADRDRLVYRKMRIPN